MKIKIALLTLCALPLLAAGQTMALNSKISSAEPKDLKYKWVTLATGTNAVASTTNLQFTAAIFYGLKAVTNNAPPTANVADAYIGFRDAAGAITTANTPAIFGTVEFGYWLGFERTGTKYNLADLYFVGTTGDRILIVYEQ